MQSVPRSISYDPELEILVINPIAEVVGCEIHVLRSHASLGLLIMGHC